MGIGERLTAQGVKPTGAVGRVVAWTMPLLFGSLYADVARLLDLRGDDSLLDVACGSGVFLDRHASHVAHVAGIDHSDVQIAMARRRLRRRLEAGTAEIEGGDATALPWDLGTFSAVTCNCLGCFSEPEHAVEEMCRVLRPGGRAVIAVDFYGDEESAQKAQRRWALPTWTERTLDTQLREAGFADVRIAHGKRMTYATARKP